MPPETAPDRAEAFAGLGSACALLLLAVALPPETHPWSRAACQVIGVAAALLLLARHRGRELAPRWILLLLPLFAASILSAACRPRAADEAADATLLVFVGMLGRRLAGSGPARRAVAVVLVSLGAAVSLQALLQHYVTYPGWAEALQAGGQPASSDLVAALQTGRPRGPFILPAALGGFLALALPLSVSLSFRPGRWTAWRAATLLASILQVDALALTRSIGAVIGLAAGLLLVLRPRRSGRRAMIGAAILLVAALGAAHFLLERRSEVSAAGLDPLSLRLGNWGAAARMVRDHPLFGTGPGSFATFYPRYMRPGMNETRYAHNSYLQAASGWGLWILFPIGSLLVALGRSVRRATAWDPERIGILAGGCSFLVHNLGDFTAYLPGVALPAAILIGIAIEAGLPAGAPIAAAHPVRSRALLLAALLPLAALVALHALERAKAQVLVEEALAASEKGDLPQAVERARRAGRLRPDDPDPAAFVAELVLAHFRDDPGRMAEGQTAAARAVAADPESAILHYTRALYHQAAGETAPAYREIRTAHSLYPLKRLYQVASADGQEPAP